MYAHTLCPIFLQKLILNLNLWRTPTLLVEFCLFENTSTFQATLDSKHALENSKLQLGVRYTRKTSPETQYLVPNFMQIKIIRTQVLTNRYIVMDTDTL